MADTYNMSDYLETQIYNHLLRTNTWSKPSALYFGLTSGIPVSSNTGSNVPEFGFGAGYARVNYGAPADSGWSVKAADAAGNNNLVIQFPDASAQWGTASGFFIADASTAGNMLMWGSLTTPKLIQVTDAPRFTSGTLSVNFD